jgi:hypothetical protein
MPTAQAGDFQMGFPIRCIAAPEQLAERFRVWSFRTYLLFGNRWNNLPILALVAKASQFHVP